MQEVNVIYYTRYPTEQLNGNESKRNYCDKTKTSKISLTEMSVKALGAQNSTRTGALEKEHFTVAM